MVEITTIREKFCPGLAQLHRECYTPDSVEALSERHFRSHCERYPAGNFVALVSGKIVGIASGFLMDFDFRYPAHRFVEAAGDDFFSGHTPRGEFYYGAGIAVHPSARGRGIGRKLHCARKRVVREMNKRGIVGGSLLANYSLFPHSLSLEQYARKVVAQEIYDPILAFHLRNGFLVRGVLPNYTNAPFPRNCAALVCWENLEFHREGPAEPECQ